MTTVLSPRLKSKGTTLPANTATVIYECPARFTAKVDLVFITNTGSGNKTVTLEWYDDTDSTWYYILAGYIVSAYSFVKLSDGYLVMNTGDKLRATSEAGSSMSTIVSVEEYFDPSNQS